MKLCECGCGRPTLMAARTERARGLVAGQPLRFLRGHYRRPKRSAEQREASRLRANLRTRQFRALHPDLASAWHKEHYARYADTIKRRKREKAAALRREVLEHYGGSPPACACCSESRYEFLALDHVHGKGQQHRREHTKGLGGESTYRWAVKNGFPPIFRVLCHNCNSALGYYGFCPHQRERGVHAVA